MNLMANFSSIVFNGISTFFEKNTSSNIELIAREVASSYLSQMISLKDNVMTRLEFELPNYNLADKQM